MARTLDTERVGVIEDVRNVSGSLERFLIDRGETLVRLAARLMADARRGMRERGKSDPIDVAIARAALRDGVENLPTARLAAFTGLRMRELLALRWRDVDFARSAVRVRASYYAGHPTTPKSGKVRAVPLAPDVAGALAQLGLRRDWVGDDDLVFAGVAGAYLDGSAVRRRYKDALMRASPG
jgi:integrase